MFSAVIKVCNNSSTSSSYNVIILVRNICGSNRVGFYNSTDHVLKIYNELLNYNNFDIDYLDIANHHKIKIEQCKLEKYSGKLT